MPIVRKLLDADDKGYPTRVAYSPDGARLAVLGTQKRMTMLPLAGGKPKGVSGPAWGPLAFSHDGALIVLGEMTTSVFDATSLKKVWSTKSDAATCAAFSPDGVTLAVGSTMYGIPCCTRERARSSTSACSRARARRAPSPSRTTATCSSPPSPSAASSATR